MSIPLAICPDPGKLRPLLHAEVDRLSDEHLSLAHRALLEIELHQLAGELDEAADAANNAAKLTLESIAVAVAEHQNSLNDLDFDEEESKFKSPGSPVFDSRFQSPGSKNIRCRVGSLGGGG